MVKLSQVREVCEAYDLKIIKDYSGKHYKKYPYVVQAHQADVEALTLNVAEFLLGNPKKKVMDYWEEWAPNLLLALSFTNSIDSLGYSFLYALDENLFEDDEDGEDYEEEEEEDED